MKDIVTMRLNNLHTQNKETEATQLENLQTPVQGHWSNALGQLTAQKVNDVEAMQLKNWQIVFQRNRSKAFEGLAFQRSMKLQHDKWRTYNPKVKDIVTKRVDNLQPKGQGHWSNARGEFSTQILKNKAWQLRSFQT